MCDSANVWADYCCTLHGRARTHRNWSLAEPNSVRIALQIQREHTNMRRAYLKTPHNQPYFFAVRFVVFFFCRIIIKNILRWPSGLIFHKFVYFYFSFRYWTVFASICCSRVHSVRGVLFIKCNILIHGANQIHRFRCYYCYRSDGWAKFQFFLSFDRQSALLISFQFYTLHNDVIQRSSSFQYVKIPFFLFFFSDFVRFIPSMKSIHGKVLWV